MSIAQKKEDEKMAQVSHVASVVPEKKKESVVHILEKRFDLRKCTCEKMSVLLLRLVRFWGEKTNHFNFFSAFHVCCGWCILMLEREVGGNKDNGKKTEETARIEFRR